MVYRLDDTTAGHRLSIDLYRQLVDYNPDTGSMTWCRREPKHYNAGVTLREINSWNGRYAGRPAFTSRTKFGHTQGSVMGSYMLGHRLAWALHYGEFPSDHIDHINGVPDDNRIANLRIAPRGKNQKNRKKNRNNKSGVSGVYWHKSNQKWKAAFRVNGDEIHVGYFADKDDAASAVKLARMRHGFTERHGV